MLLKKMKHILLKIILNCVQERTVWYCKETSLSDRLLNIRMHKKYTSNVALLLNHFINKRTVLCIVLFKQCLLLNSMQILPKCIHFPSGFVLK